MGKFTSAGALLSTKHDLLLLRVTKGCWKITPRILLSRGSAHALPEITKAGKAAALFSIRGSGSEMVAPASSFCHEEG